MTLVIYYEASFLVMLLKKCSFGQTTMPNLIIIQPDFFQNYGKLLQKEKYTEIENSFCTKQKEP